MKEKNDKRIKELEAELARKKVDDAEMLQDMKAECLRAQKQFKMASQEAAKEAKTQLKVNNLCLVEISKEKYRWNL